MARRPDPEASAGPGPADQDRDEILGEAIETYLELVEGGCAPNPEEFAARYPELQADLEAALEGLSLVRGLVGSGGPGHRLESGRRIAGYKIVGELGRGGMGIVYEAVHVDLDRPVALKILGGHAAPDSTSRRRFLNEARTAAGLHHTHIVPVFDVGQVGGLCYYAMQRIEGSGLDRVLKHLRRDRSTAAGTGSSLFNGTGASRAALLWSKVASRWPRSNSKSGDSDSTLRLPPPLSLSKGPGSPPGELGTDPRSGVVAPLALARPLDVSASALNRRGAEGSGLAGFERVDQRADEAPPFVPPRGSAYYRWVAEVGRMAAEALAFAHLRGIIHRDVKPSNLLIDARGNVWMTDFGLARRLADPGLTHHEGMLGTPRYMSPEQARTGPIDGRTDVYSLGATLYELLTLRPPYDGKSTAELVDQIRDREPIAPRSIDPKVPRDLETIVLKALAKRPSDRYASAQELADDLVRFLRFEPVRARRISVAGRLWRVARRHPAVSLVSTAAAVTVLTVVAVAYHRVVRERDDAVSQRQQKETELRLRTVAEAKERAARAAQALSEASAVRFSSITNRRARGLNLLKMAATLDSDPGLQSKLRDEALEFLVLRDVEERLGFATEHARAITFGPGGERLAALSLTDEGEEVVSLWDVESRQPLETQRLRPEGVSGTPGDSLIVPPAPGKAAGRGPGRGGMGLALAGSRLIVRLPAAQGFRLLDVGTGAPLCDVSTEGRQVTTIAAAPRDTHFVTVEAASPIRPRTANAPPGPPPATDEFKVRLWDAQTDEDKPFAPPRLIATLESWRPAPGTYPIVAVSPDGRTVATAKARTETTISLWSTEDGTALEPIEPQTELTALAIGSHGQLAAMGNGAIRLWDLDAPRTAPTSLNTERSSLTQLRFSPNGNLLAAAGSRIADVELWDTAAHALVAVLPTPDGVSDLAFAPDGRTLAATSRNAETTVWNLVEPEARTQFSGLDPFTISIAFRADGLMAVASPANRVQYWRPGRCVGTSPSADDARDASKEKEPPRASASPLNRFDRPLALGFDDQGRLLALESMGFTMGLRIWSNPMKSSLSTRMRVPLSSPPSPRFFAGAIMTRSADGRTFLLARQQRILIWRSAEPDITPLLKPPASVLPYDTEISTDALADFTGDTNPADFLTWSALALAPDGKRLYLVDNGGDTRAWSLDLDSDEVRQQVWDLPGAAVNLALSPDGQTLALSLRTGGVALVDARTGSITARLRAPIGESESQIRTLAFAPDSRSLATGTTQGQIQIWSLADTAAPLLRLPGRRGLVTALTYDSTGRYLAAGSIDKLIDVWDLQRIHSALGQLGLDW